MEFGHIIEACCGAFWKVVFLGGECPSKNKEAASALPVVATLVVLAFAPFAAGGAIQLRRGIPMQAYTVSFALYGAILIFLFIVCQ